MSISARPICPSGWPRSIVLYRFLLNKWYFDELYDLIFVRPAKWLGRFFWKQGDGWSLTASAPTASPRGCGHHRRVVKLQTGFVYHYAFAMLIGIAALITWSVRRSLFR
jgi:NADH-quinone oxidoreductase subunit L